MRFRALKEAIKPSDIPSLRAEIENAVNNINGDNEKYKEIVELLKSKHDIIPANLSEEQKDELAGVWANTIIYDGFDGDFTQMLVSLVGQDSTISSHADKMRQLWILYDEGRLKLLDGIFPPKEFYGHPALYKDTSNQDFEYLVNAEMIVNHKNEVSQYLRSIPTADDVRKVFFKDYKRATGLNDARTVYENIEELSTKYGERGGLMSIMYAVEDNSGNEYDKMPNQKIAESLSRYVSDYILQTDSIEMRSKSGHSVDSYLRAISELANRGDSIKTLISAKLCSDTRSETIANAIINWLDKNVNMENF